ncbi:MAG: hypothetical protein H8D45_24310 [Bacteroidetes bacterium]|nr:hypothetical protein [Bacteroidota bacterium]
MALSLRNNLPEEDAEAIWSDWVTVKDDREPWIRARLRGEQFARGKQWTKEEKDKLAAIGQPDYISNEIFPAIQSILGDIYSKAPSYTFTSNLGRDVTVHNYLLHHIFNISRMSKITKNVVRSAFHRGVGYFYVWENKESYYGLGDVNITFLNSRDVYVPKSCKMDDFSDAPYIYWSRLMRAEDVAQQWDIPLEKVEDEMVCGYDETYMDDVDAESETQSNDDKYAGDVNIKNKDDLKFLYVRLITRFRRVKEEVIVYFNNITGQRVILPKEHKFNDDEKRTIAIGTHKAIKTRRTLIEMCTVAGSHGYILDNIEYLDLQHIFGGTSYYPIVPLYYVDTESPYPDSSIQYVEGQQKLINKAHSIVLYNAQIGSNPGYWGPKGWMGDDETEIDQLLANLAIPGGAVEYNIDPVTGGKPEMRLPLPLNNAFYSIMQGAKQQLQHAFGRYGIDMGDPTDAPQTKGATLAIRQWGQGRLADFFGNLDDCFDRIGKVVLKFMQKVYSYNRTFHLVSQLSKNPTQFNINIISGKDEHGLPIIENNILGSDVDVVVKSGSAYPTHRQMLLDILTTLLNFGMPVGDIIVQYTDLSDEEKDIIVKRVSAAYDIEQMKKVIEEQGNKIAKLEAEKFSANIGREIERTKGDLKAIKAKASEASKNKSDVSKNKSVKEK